MYMVFEYMNTDVFSTHLFVFFCHREGGGEEADRTALIFRTHLLVHGAAPARRGVHELARAGGAVPSAVTRDGGRGGGWRGVHEGLVRGDGTGMSAGSG